MIGAADELNPSGLKSACPPKDRGRLQLRWVACDPKVGPGWRPMEGEIPDALLPEGERGDRRALPLSQQLESPAA